MPDSAVSAASANALAASTTTARVTSLDIVRGAAMVLMAIDHVRVYSGVPAGGPTFGVFFARWITNFVPPALVFLAGTSACLHGVPDPPVFPVPVVRQREIIKAVEASQFYLSVQPT